MSKHDIKKGDRVTWTDDKSDAQVKGQVLKVFRNGRAQVLSADFEKFNIELSRLSLHSRQLALIEMPEIEEELIRHWETDADGIDLPPNSLDPNSLDPNSPDPNSPDPNSPDPNSPDPNSPDPNSPDPNSPDPNFLDPNLPQPGNYEKKKVKGHLYLYWRWWDGKVRRSRYVGKVEANN
jgi:hypothetical protein